MLSPISSSRQQEQPPPSSIRRRSIESSLEITAEYSAEDMTPVGEPRALLVSSDKAEPFPTTSILADIENELSQCARSPATPAKFGAHLDKLVSTFVGRLAEVEAENHELRCVLRDIPM